MQIDSITGIFGVGEKVLVEAVDLVSFRLCRFI